MCVADKKRSIAPGRKFFDQCGEDRILEFIFNVLRTEKPSYIDIGANHPFIFNNTALFYLKGSKGISIEYNPELHTKLEQMRPRDINLNIGIGESKDISTYYIMDAPRSIHFLLKKSKNCVNGGAGKSGYH